MPGVDNSGCRARIADGAREALRCVKKDAWSTAVESARRRSIGAWSTTVESARRRSIGAFSLRLFGRRRASVQLLRRRRRVAMSSIDLPECLRRGAIGAFGAIPGTLAAHPFDVIKMNQQVSGNAASAVLSSIGSVSRL